MFNFSLRTISALGVSAALLAVVMGVAARTDLADAAPLSADPTSPRELIVSGTGRVSVEPDQANITVGVQFTAPTLTEASRQASENITRVLDAIKALGVDAKDIQTSSYSITPLNTYQEGQAPTIIGYQVSNILVVRVRSVASVGKVLDAALGAAANYLGDVSWTLADSTAAESQARTLAVRDATRIAQVLAQAAGLTLGPVTSIQENVSTVPGPRPYARDAVSQAAGAPPVETGSLDVTTTVEMRFTVQ